MLKERSTLSGGPQINAPAELREAHEGVCVYFNPEEGMEVFARFNVLRAALEKRGQGLDEDDAETVAAFLRSEEIGPGFVRL